MRITKNGCKMALSKDSSGFSILQVLFSLSILGIILMSFNSSLFKNLTARNSLNAKLGYVEINDTMYSFINQSLLSPPASGCVTTAKLKQDLEAADFLKVTPLVAANLNASDLERLDHGRSSAVKAAVGRCMYPKNITAPSNPADNKIYFCVLFSRPANFTDGSLLNTRHAFAEYRIELINQHTGQGLSCDDYRTLPQAGANIYYRMYWVNSGATTDTYSIFNGIHHVAK